MFQGTAIFYTADLNMRPESEGVTKTIDFCFVDKKYWRGTAYKVVKDHKYSQTASDHYPLCVEIERI